MAKRKRASKSEAIRNYMAEHPEATTDEISQAVKATAALIYNVKANMKKAAAKGTKTGTRRGRGGAKNGVDVATNQVVLAAKLIQECGGYENARSALNAAEQVVVALQI